MFRRIDGADGDQAGTLTFEEREVPFRPGDSVAAALLAAGVASFRDGPADGSPRSPYCMMGVCFECLVDIDGRQNQQSCLIAARPGMAVRRQSGARLIAETGNV